ncbi:cyclic nucleotide-binding domain-containing protein [Catenovulum maritimum]|uniref:Cyclic nucleotide-binding domain-containing protein n=1 Tax=Catenovulum maritimum TaxID=1513271 RepID=A0A0J8GUV4_9ALTE|nr:cyclic nucleotide-binding domain-containing protein [Catenovulum maritimum]KMT66555.1 hypothetical protein XM47_03200 [Catenovulum maritimum]
MKNVDSKNIKLLKEIVHRVPLFSTLSEAESELLIKDEANFVVAEADEFIIHEGETGVHFYVLLSGLLKVTKGTNKADELSVIHPGEFVGEVGFMTNQARTANVVAVEKSILLRLEQASLSRFPTNIRDQFKDKIIEGLIDRVNHLNDELVELKHINQQNTDNGFYIQLDDN